MGNCCTQENILPTPSLDLATLENTAEFTLQGHKCDAKVVDVHDGDTITLAFVFGGKIFHKSCRVEGVDCAEIRTKNIEEKNTGLEARNYVKDLLLHKIVWAEFSDTNDKYGRLLASIYPQKGGESLDKTLIAMNYGYEYHGEKKIKFDHWHKN